jgi:glycosyltransferase involved in cell wall biosynthesis
MTSVDIPVYTGDFRLLDKRVLREFKNMRKQARFVRDMVSWVGFKQTKVTYERHERYAGETKFLFMKMLKFAIYGMFSFSQVPSQFSSIFGFLSAGVSFILMIYGLVMKYFFLIRLFLTGRACSRRSCFSGCSYSSPLQGYFRRSHRYWPFAALLLSSLQGTNG